MTLTVLVTDRYTTESLTQLAAASTNIKIIKTGTHPSAEELKVADVMLIRSRTVIDKKLLDQAPNLKTVITATSGTDHIDITEAENRGIKVINTPGANTEAAAELTLMLMLGVLRRLPEVQKQMQAGNWKDTCPTGGELRTKTVGLIGLGRVGSRVAEFLNAFGSHVIAFDPYQDDEVFNRLKVERLGLTEVLAQADIISLHVPLTKETRRMIRLETLELCQEGVIIINTSRGQVIDESGLTTALETKQVAGAGLDVFEHEPLANESRLRQMPQVLITPHIGAYTDEAFQRASLEAVSQVPPQKS